MALNRSSSEHRVSKSWIPAGSRSTWKKIHLRGAPFVEDQSSELLFFYLAYSRVIGN
jgi:hypothetical protein